MTEYARTETHQYCDVELAVIIDTVTGKLERPFGADAVGTFDEALRWLINRGCKGRHAIIKVNCVGAFPFGGKS